MSLMFLRGLAPSPREEWHEPKRGAEEADTVPSEAEIRTLLDSWVAAIRAKDSNVLASDFAPDARLFDLIAPCDTAAPMR